MDIIKKMKPFLLEKAGYQEFFKKKLKEFGVGGVSELSDADKKKFFDQIEKEWKGIGE